MELRERDRLFGFTVDRIRDIEEVEGQLVEMSHDKTGAHLVWVRNEDENKLFSVGFKTLPEDSTGVFHILEHSVLCGSDKYPVKEPFVELIKTSMNTFLNAMTYPDKTLYPVSSRMEQDYLNLMDVYLDAVFCPKILTDPNIFYQEGWHIDTTGEAPAFLGVVYNEMKGAMSDVDQILERTMNKLLFPESPYGFNSGGDPEAIPELSYEDFVARYKKFYHPTNSYFYLDGNIPLETTLERINSYLQNYDKLEDVPELDIQVPRKADEVRYYEVGSEDERAAAAIARIVGSWEDRGKQLGLNVLTTLLADSNESPLARAALSSGLASDMDLYLYEGIAQPYLMMIFRGIDPGALSRYPEFSEAKLEELPYEKTVELAVSKLIQIVEDAAIKLLDDGIPRDDLHAIVNQMDFTFRQYAEPQALYRASFVFCSWLYDGDPAMFLRTKSAISELRDMIDSGEIDKLAKEYFTDYSSFSSLTLLPSTTLGAIKAEEEEARLQAILRSMSQAASSAEEIDPAVMLHLDELNANLAAWQEAPDSEEALATIPTLEISDINPMPELIPTEESKIGDVTMLYHKLPTKGIVYINAYFPLTGLSIEELPSAALVSEFYKDLPTENYTVLQLQTEIKKYLGELSFGIEIMSRDADPSSCTPYLRARASALSENLSHAEDLIIEVMTRTRFDDESLMKEVVTQLVDEGKRYAISAGHKFAMYAARSHFTSRDAAAEALNGYTFLRYIGALSEAFDDRIDDFAIFANKLVTENVVKQGAVISVTASEPQDMTKLAGMIPDGQPRPATASYTSSLPMRLGIEIPSQVSYAVTAYDLNSMGAKPNGSLAVAANILSFAYLWNEVRVKGGAYGTGVSAKRDGCILCYSYRDPSPDRSLGIYKTIPSYIEKLDTDLDGFIISTIATTEPLISPAFKGISADDFWFSNHTDDKRIERRSQILGTKLEELHAWAPAFEKLAAQGAVCVLGHRSALASCEDLEIRQL